MLLSPAWKMSTLPKVKQSRLLQYKSGKLPMQHQFASWHSGCIMVLVLPFSICYGGYHEKASVSSAGKHFARQSYALIHGYRHGLHKYPGKITITNFRRFISFL